MDNPNSSGSMAYSYMIDTDATAFWVGRAEVDGAGVGRLARKASSQLHACCPPVLQHYRRGGILCCEEVWPLPCCFGDSTKIVSYSWSNVNVASLCMCPILKGSRRE